MHRTYACLGKHCALGFQMSESHILWPMPRQLMYFQHMTISLGPILMTTLVRLWRITDPNLCASGALPCRGLLSRSRAVAGCEGGKATGAQSDFPCPKSWIFNQFISKFRLDNTIGIRIQSSAVAV